MAEKKPVGRPTKYRPEFCEMLIQHMSQGYSFETFGALVNTHRAVLYDWVKKHTEFDDAKRQATEMCQQFWERKGIENLETKHFNSSVWIFNMKNRFRWNDNQEIKVETKSEITADPIVSEFAPKILEALNKINESKK